MKFRLKSELQFFQFLFTLLSMVPVCRLEYIVVLQRKGARKERILTEKDGCQRARHLE